MMSSVSLSALGRLRPLLTSIAKHNKACVTSAVRQYSDSNHVLRSQVPHMDFKTGNFSEFVMADNAGRANNIAFECDLTPRKMSYGELRDRMGRWGAFLQKKGLGKGSVVAVVSPNTLDYPAVILGTIAAGGVFTGANPTYPADGLAYQLKDSNAALVVCFGPLEPVVQKALEMNKQNIPVYSMGPESPSKLPRVEDIMSDSSLGFAEPLKLEGSEPMMILYSSGTTGMPKGTPITHNAAIANTQMMMHPDFFHNSHSTVSDQKSTLQMLPLFHVGGFLVVTMPALTAGVKIHNLTKLDPSTFVPFLQERKITSLPLVPTVLNLCLTKPEFNAENFGHVEHILSGAAPIPPSSSEEVKRRFGDAIFLQHGYGMTETLANAMDSKKSGMKLGFTGQLLPTMEIKIVDLETGKSLPANTDGEICMKSVCNMKGYLNNEEATRATLDDDGWLHSGDVGHYDEDGYLKIIDRTKELIKVNAFQVSPSELESIILEIPEVAEVSVIGVPNDRLGEAPRAYVIAASKIAEEKVVEHVKSRCAKIKHLVGGVRFLDQLPKNATGKVMRKELVKMYKEGI